MYGTCRIAVSSASSQIVPTMSRAVEDGGVMSRCATTGDMDMHVHLLQFYYPASPNKSCVRERVRSSRDCERRGLWKGKESEGMGGRRTRWEEQRGWGVRRGRRRKR